MSGGVILGYQHLNVLIVDDQPGVRYLLDAIVREEGHSPILAANGLEAVEIARTAKPHLVFMDIRMPVMNGMKALERMKELGSKSDFVIMTAFTDMNVIDNEYKNGVIKCLIKPFDVDEIKEILHEASHRKYRRASAL